MAPKHDGGDGMTPAEALELLGVATVDARGGNAKRDCHGKDHPASGVYGGSDLADRYLVALDDGGLGVLRIDRPEVQRLGLDRAAEFQALQIAAAAGLGPAPLAAAPEQGLLFTAWVPGRAWARADLLVGRNLERAAFLLKAVHELPAEVPVVDLRAAIERYAKQAGPEHAALAAGLHVLLREAGSGESPGRFCHGDPFAANFIEGHPGSDGAGRLCLIDWEYAGLNEIWFDLAALAGHNELPPEADEVLLASYLGRQPKPGERRHLAGWRRFYEGLAVLWTLAAGGSRAIK